MPGAKEELEGFCRELFPDYTIEVEDLGKGEGFFPHIINPDDGREIPFYAAEMVLDFFDTITECV